MLRTHAGRERNPCAAGIAEFDAGIVSCLLGRSSRCAQATQVLDGAVVGTLEGGLVAVELGEVIGAFSVGEPGGGKGVSVARYLRGGLGFGTTAEDEAPERDFVPKAGRKEGNVSAKDAGLHGGQALEAPGGAHDAVHKFVFDWGSGLVCLVETVPEPEEGGGILLGKDRVGSEGAVPKGVEPDASFAGWGFGAGGLEGVAAIGVDAGGRGHGDTPQSGGRK
jgi:hypothetical protein